MTSADEVDETKKKKTKTEKKVPRETARVRGCRCNEHEGTKKGRRERMQESRRGMEEKGFD